MSADTGHPTVVVPVMLRRSHSYRAQCRGCTWTSKTYGYMLTAAAEGELHAEEMRQKKEV